ncbi:helix-turn-helix transcriptional regulator [bacterium]|nr:helix-turn-helix transcriptional regulator [bacterium]
METDILLKLGQKIRYERTKRKMSQEQLAELADLNFRSISYIECGRHDVKCTTLEKIAKAFDMEVYELLHFVLS